MRHVTCERADSDASAIWRHLSVRIVNWSGRWMVGGRMWVGVTRPTHVISIWNFMATLFVTFTGCTCVCECASVWVASNFCFEVYLSRSLIRQPGASAHHPLFVCALTWKILFVITFYGLTRQQHLDKKNSESLAIFF